MMNWKGFGRKQFYPNSWYYLDIWQEALRKSMISGIGNRSANHLTITFYMNVHLLCSAVTAPGALHYLPMPSFTVYNLWTSLDLLSYGTNIFSLIFS